MSPDHRRAERVAQAVRMEVATFLQEGAKDPRLQAIVTVTAVDVARDLKTARIFVSMMGSESERASTMDALTSMTGHLRTRLTKSLNLRVAPELRFRIDESAVRAARIESLLAQVRPPKDGDEGKP